MSGTAEYRVLARKYRPTTFGELIGHDTLVRTLTNAFNSGRIAHAFMLTGVRGVGKTTTARLIARALNCIGPDGAGGPTMSPCGQCDPCRAIAEDRHPDVIEMDAASRTGVDDMRELIESVRYRPVSARYKIYIVDEVHMLSKAAFNALLKTLEEPPPDIKFVFATTEINKVPVTVLSRCQRYTLPRIPEAMLADYYGTLAVREAVSVEPAALALIARAADGSVRDGLSILDQAIALGFGQTITESSVRDMLGVADRGLTFDLFEALMGGDAADALSRLEALYNGGTDPAMVMQDLLDITHFVTRLKLERPNDPAAAAAPRDDGQDRQRGAALAGKLGIAALARCWQMLLKGLGEVQTAPQPMKAAEMALIRLVFVADLPPPAEIVKALQNGAAARPAPNGGAGPGGNGPRAQAEPPARPMAMVVGGMAGGAVARREPALAEPTPAAGPDSFAAVMDLLAHSREGILYGQLANCVHLVRFEPGHLEFRPTADAPRDLSTRLGQFLLESTGRRWLISVSRDPGQPTLRQQAEQRDADRLAQVSAHPLVQAALSVFPGAEIHKITEPESEALPLELPNEIKPLEPEAAPTLYDNDDPGPFDGESWDIDEIGDDS
ncbi:MAG: polymerase subunit gamma/tau [Aliidongia sp.]|nr:polymerase subunit gamma/tau [Aliidongia sp.]